MGLILLEALGALVILIGIVWWTMFSGRKNGERPSAPQDKTEEKK
jgi:cytoskeletal protein RodZ